MDRKYRLQGRVVGIIGDRIELKEITIHEAIAEWNETAFYCPEHMSQITALEDLLPHQRKALLEGKKLV